MVKLFLQAKLDVLQAEFLLSRNANLDFLDNTGNGAIHYSTKTSNRGHISWLQAHGANLDLPDKFGNTSLHIAVMLNNQSLANWFLTQNDQLTINIRNLDGLTPVHFAAQTEFLEQQMDWLKSLNANFEARTVSGWRPIDYAIQRVRDDNVMLDEAKQRLRGLGMDGSIEGIGIKGKKNVQLNDDLSNKIRKAKNRRGSIMALSSVGAGVNDGLDPFNWREDGLNAPLKAKPKTPRVGLGGRRNALEGAEHVPWKKLRKLWWHDDPPKGPPLLPKVIEAARLGQKELAKFLIKREQHDAHPEKLEARNKHDRTALLYAVTHGHTEIAKTLMEAGADPFDYKGKVEKWKVQMEFDRKKRTVRRAARDESERMKMEKEKAAAALLRRQEMEKKRQDKIKWNIRYGSDHAVTLKKQLDLHPNVTDLSDKLQNELTARVSRIESELKEDPFLFLANQEIVVVDRYLERLLTRMEGHHGTSPYTQHSDPSWPPVVKFGIPNLGWKARECRRILGQLSTSHRVSKGYDNFSKMESDGNPIARRRQRKRRTTKLGAETYNVYGNNEDSDKEGEDSDDEEVMTNMMLDML